MNRINLFAGPGAGKSVTSARLFYNLKLKNLNVELVHEYIKNWAYQKRIPKSFDQYYIFSKQMYAENLLLSNGVDFIVTDSPLLLQIPYCIESMLPGWESLVNMCREFDKKYKPINIFLNRGGIEYIPYGRYQQSIEEAVQMDNIIIDFLDSNNIVYKKFNTKDFDAILEYCLNKVYDN